MTNWLKGIGYDLVENPNGMWEVFQNGKKISETDDLQELEKEYQDDGIKW